MKKRYVSFSIAFLLSLMAVGTNTMAVRADNEPATESNEIARDGDIENQVVLTDDGTLHILGGDNVVTDLRSLVIDDLQRSKVIKISFDGKTVAPQEMDSFF